MNTGNTYYFIDDFNKICKCENGMKSDESIVLETYELVDDVNRLVEKNEQLKSSDTITDLETEIMNLKTTIHQLRTDNTKQKKKLNTAMKENEQLKEIIYEDESQIIGEWSSFIEEDMKKLDKAYESDINDLIKFCKRS